MDQISHSLHVQISNLHLISIQLHHWIIMRVYAYDCIIGSPFSCAWVQVHLLILLG